MRDGIAGLGLLKTSFDLRQKVESLYSVLNGCILWEVLNGSNNILFSL